jgi:hypothetical protein
VSVVEITSVEIDRTALEQPDHPQRKEVSADEASIDDSGR